MQRLQQILDNEGQHLSYEEDEKIIKLVSEMSSDFLVRSLVKKLRQLERQIQYLI